MVMFHWYGFGVFSKTGGADAVPANRRTSAFGAHKHLAEPRRHDDAQLYLKHLSSQLDNQRDGLVSSELVMLTEDALAPLRDAIIALDQALRPALRQ